MTDPYVLTTGISTAGALLGVLGGAGLNSWAQGRQDDRRSRQDEQRARQDEQRAAAQRTEEHAARCLAACTDLLSGAADLRMQLQILGQRYWADMNLKLQAAQDQATAVGRCAALVTVLVPGVPGDSALLLARSAGDLAAQAVRQATVGVRARPDEQYLGGELPAPLDLSDLDARVDAFRDAVGVAITPAGVPAAEGPPVVAAQPGPGPAQPGSAQPGSAQPGSAQPGSASEPAAVG